MWVPYKKGVKSLLFSAIQFSASPFQRKHDLVIIDDAFPNVLSPFRVSEFTYYLQNITNSRVFCTCTAFRWLHDERSYKQVKKEFSHLFPDCQSKVRKYNRLPFKAKLLYFVFYSNTAIHLELIHKLKIPFVFTLYPGGGFQLNNPSIDRRLRTIFTSPFFKHVIVTTKTTYEYLLQKNMCPAEKIRFIYGLVIPTNAYGKVDRLNGKRYKQGKATLDICFVAHKYADKGLDKGYDTFIAVAHEIICTVQDVRFHVVGNFSKEDIDVSKIGSFIHFHGPLKTSEFKEFYANMDIILSPNKSFVLNEGGFDGFPTGSCIEAGLNEVALFVTDDLIQNIHFDQKKDLVIIDANPQKIAKEILYYREHPAELRAIAESGRKKIETLYNKDVQMSPRLELLRSYMAFS